MKKFILISSLLAAGTLAAMAETQISALVYLSFDAEPHPESWTIGGANRTNSVTNNITGITGSTNTYMNYYEKSEGAIGTYAYHNDANYLIVDNTALAKDNQISYTQSWTIGFSFSTASESFDDWAYLFGIGDNSSRTGATNYISISTTNYANKSLAVYSGGAITDITNTEGKKENADGTTTYLDVSTGTHKIALVYDYNSTSKTGTFTLYVDGTKISYSDELDLSDATITQIHLGDGFLASTGTNTKHKGLYDEFVIYDDALTASQVKTYLSDGTKASPLVITIPEPSLFGLLAGTLALGLAGTRRRRGNAK